MPFNGKQELKHLTGSAVAAIKHLSTAGLAVAGAIGSLYSRSLTYLTSFQLSCLTDLVFQTNLSQDSFKQEEV